MTGETDFIEYNGVINCDFDNERGLVFTYQKLYDEMLSTVAILNLNDLKSVKDQG